MRTTGLGSTLRLGANLKKEPPQTLKTHFKSDLSCPKQSELPLTPSVCQKAKDFLSGERQLQKTSNCIYKFSIHNIQHVIKIIRYPQEGISDILSEVHCVKEWSYLGTFMTMF